MQFQDYALNGQKEYSKKSKKNKKEKRKGKYYATLQSGGRDDRKSKKSKKNKKEKRKGKKDATLQSGGRDDRKNPKLGNDFSASIPVRTFIIEGMIGMLFQVDASEPIELNGEKLVRSFLHYDSPLLVTQNVFVRQIY